MNKKKLKIPENVTAEVLRKFLYTSMLELRSGEITVSQAHNIAKLAAQLNENIHLEMKARIAELDYRIKLGNLTVG